MNPLLLILLFLSFIALPSLAAPFIWHSCSRPRFDSWFDTAPLPDMKCGSLYVPLQYKTGTSAGRPGKHRKIKLALTLLPATGVRKGSIVIISGGPGQSGIDPSLDPDGPVAELRRNWDIVGYDPRGVGHSTPRISCAVPEKSSDSIASDEQNVKKMLDACVARTGAEVLKHTGTDEAVSDLDFIRKALGDDKLTAVAYSYGTQVAAFYAVRFPDHVRALVLDGVVDIEESRNDLRWRLNQAKSYQRTFERFAAWCAETRSCPLSSDRFSADAQFHTLLNKIDSGAFYNDEGHRISSDDIISFTMSRLLWRSSWPELATVVKQLSDTARAGSGAESKISLPTDKAAPDNESDALSVITCVDQPVNHFSRDEILRQRKIITEAFSATNFKPHEDASIDLCDIWPFKNSIYDKEALQVPHLPQILFVSQRHDPTTPWRNARAMATLFRGPLLTLEGDGHTMALYGVNKCVDTAVVNYLLSPGKKRNDKICH